MNYLQFLRRSLAARAAQMFASGEQGVWYDPSNLSTLFQDSAFTVPVTAVEQPVGGMLDLSGRGNHASQPTTTKRTVYSRRVNLLTKTEEMTPFDNPGVGWSQGAFGNWILPINLGAQLAPDGTNTAVGLGAGPLYTVSSAVHRVNVSPGASIVFRVWVRKVEGEDQSGLAGLCLVLQTGNNGALVSAYTPSVLIGESVTDAWQQFEIRYTTPATGVNQVEAGIWFSYGPPAAVAVWGASLTLATDAHLPYQRVNTDTDYDADPAKFPAYLRFDGVDDALQTGNIDFTGTDKMTVWAGVTKLSDASNGLVYEFGSPESVNDGSFSMWAPINLGAAPLGVTAKGLSRSVAATSTFSGVASGVVAQDISLSAPRNALRLNGATLSTETTALGGSFGNYPLYIGARAGTSLFFNGRLGCLIVRGAQSTLSQIEATEAYIKQKMRMP